MKFLDSVLCDLIFFSGIYYQILNETIQYIMMEVKNINAGKRAIDCSFQVRSGEILGFYGLVGAGRSELMKAIMGLDPMDSGEIYLNGEKTKKHDPAYMQKHCIALVPESRKTEGLLLNNTIKFNTTLAVLDRFIKNLV